MNESRKTNAVWLGKPETGMPIPAEQMRPVMKIRRFLWSPGRVEPTSFAMGTSNKLAIVWLMKVETIWENKKKHRKNMGSRMLDIYGKGWMRISRTNTTGDRTNTTEYRENPLMSFRMTTSITSRRPLDITPLPKAIPPIARNTMVHAKCSKSS